MNELRKVVRYIPFLPLNLEPTASTAVKTTA